MSLSLFLLLLWPLIKAILILLVCVFAIAWLLKISRKDLTWGISAVVTVTLILLPIWSYSMNRDTTEILKLTFSGWSVPGIPVFTQISWALTGGAIASSLFVSLMLYFLRDRTVKPLSVLFLWIGMGLNLLAQAALPVLMFGSYGYTMISDAFVPLLTQLVMTIACTIALCFDESMNRVYTKMPPK